MKKLPIGIYFPLVTFAIFLMEVVVFNSFSVNKIGATLNIAQDTPNTLNGKSNIIRKLSYLKTDLNITEVVFEANGNQLFNYHSPHFFFKQSIRTQTYVFKNSTNSFIKVSTSPTPIQLFYLFSVTSIIFWVALTWLKFKSRSSNDLNQSLIRFAHDIRGTIKDFQKANDSHEKQRILSDIETMSSELLQKRKISTQEIYQPLEEIRDIFGIYPENLISFSIEGNKLNFRRFLRNAYENSFQAKGSQPIFSLTLKRDESNIFVVLEDDGPGFDTNILPHLGKNHITSKSSGNGVGLYSSMQALQNDGISLKFFNNLSACTEIKFSRFTIHMQDFESVILIDDDRYIQNEWKSKAEAHSINIDFFDNFKSFIAAADNIGPNVVIFCDSHLSDGQGEDLLQIAYKRGFKNLYLTTSLFNKNVKDYPWIRGVIGKKFPESILTQPFTHS